MIIMNAKIISATLGYSRGIFLDSYLHVTLQDGFSQGFGGFVLDLKDKGTKQNFTGLWIKNCLNMADVEQWSDLVGKPIRVKKVDEWGSITAIGHFLEEKWFEPKKEFDLLTAGA